MSDTPNLLTVGRRSDGMIAIVSMPPGGGSGPTSTFIMPRATARWVAEEILRLTEVETAADRPAAPTGSTDPR